MNTRTLPRRAATVTPVVAAAVAGLATVLAAPADAAPPTGGPTPAARDAGIRAVGDASMGWE